MKYSKTTRPTTVTPVNLPGLRTFPVVETVGSEDPTPGPQILPNTIQEDVHRVKLLMESQTCLDIVTELATCSSEGQFQNLKLRAEAVVKNR